MKQHHSILNSHSMILLDFTAMSKILYLANIESVLIIFKDDSFNLISRCQFIMSTFKFHTVIRALSITTELTETLFFYPSHNSSPHDMVVLPFSNQTSISERVFVHPFCNRRQHTGNGWV